MGIIYDYYYYYLYMLLSKQVPMYLDTLVILYHILLHNIILFLGGKGKRPRNYRYRRAIMVMHYTYYYNALLLLSLLLLLLYNYDRYHTTKNQGIYIYIYTGGKGEREGVKGPNSRKEALRHTAGPPGLSYIRNQKIPPSVTP